MLRQASATLTSAPARLLVPRTTPRLRYSTGFGGAESARPVTADQPQYPAAGANIRSKDSRQQAWIRGRWQASRMMRMGRYQNVS